MSIAARGKEPTALFLAAFSVLIGLLAAVVCGYGFGNLDHAELLPVVFRAMDAGYLVNDYQLNAVQGFGPRFYVAHAMAALGDLLPLWVAFAALHLITYVAIAAITAFAARDLTGSSMAALIAATIVASSLAPFWLSTPARVLDPQVLPRSLAMPFALCAVWQGILGRPLRSALSATPAILLHPALGPEAAALGWFAAMARKAPGLLSSTSVDGRDGWKGLGLAAALIASVVGLCWLAPTLFDASFQASLLSTEDFIRLYAESRVPHHLIPSGWRPEQFALGAMFVAIATVSLIELWKHGRGASVGPQRREADAQALAIAGVFAACGAAFLCGWLFVEIVPTRLFAIAQTFRLTIIVAWLGWLLIAWAIARSINDGGWWRSILSLASVASVPTLALYKTLSVLPRLPRLPRRTSLFRLVAALTLTATLASLYLVEVPHRITVLLLFAGFAAALAARASPRRALLALVGVLLLTLIAFALDRAQRLPRIPHVSSAIEGQQPALTIEETAARFESEDMARLAAAAKARTPLDAVILIPWKWGALTLHAERAVVVDFKRTFWKDEALKEQRERYAAIYDPVQGEGYPTEIDAAGLAKLRRRYGFDYAVLPAGAGFTLPTVMAADKWKLVDVSALDRDDLDDAQIR